MKKKGKKEKEKEEHVTLKKKKRERREPGKGICGKVFSPSFPPNFGGKKMWAWRENFFSSFPTFLFSFPKRIVENGIFHPIFHHLYFHPK